MIDLFSLWLPVVASTVALFFLSFLAWTVLPHHRADWNRLPDESAFGNALRELNISPGPYYFPFAADSKEMSSPEYQARVQQGPVGLLHVFSGACSMPRNLICQLLFFLAVSFCLAYLATLGLSTGDSFLAVFRLVGTAAILAYTVAIVPQAIWFNARVVGYVVDGVMYGLATGLLFALLWPGGTPS